MARLFAAIDIGSAAQDRVASEQTRLAATTQGSLRWVKHDQLHITLVFLGEVSDEQVAQAIELMQQPIARAPFRVELGEVGTFPPSGAPRALWIGVKSGVAEIMSVQAIVAERFEPLGIERERRPFRPHLTLARWRDSRPSDRPRPTERITPTIASVDVHAVTLFQSRVSSAGSTYIKLGLSMLHGGRDSA